MIAKRGEIWLADLNPTRGSEQAGTRPVVIFQHDVVSQWTTTILAVPSKAVSNIRPETDEERVCPSLHLPPVVICHRVSTA